MNVVNPLAEIRIAAGFRTVEEARLKLKCSRFHLLNVERGRCGASEALIGRMSQAYGVEPALVRETIRRSRQDLLERQVKALREAV